MIYRRNERGAWSAKISPQLQQTPPPTSWLLTSLPLPQSLYGQRSVVRWRHNKFSRMDRLPNFLNHGAPLKTPHQKLHACVHTRKNKKTNKQNKKNRVWNFLCNFFLRLNLHGIDGGTGSIDFDGLSLNNILSNQPHKQTFRMTPLTITKNNILYIYCFPHILNAHVFFACLIAIVFGTYFKYFWPCNFKKLCLCCYLQFHIELYLIRKGKN